MPQNKNSRYIQVLFTAAVASLIWRYGNVLGDRIIKPFEILIGLILFLVCLEIFLVAPRRQLFFRMLRLVGADLKLLCVLLLLSLVGFLFSYGVFGTENIQLIEVLTEGVRIFFAFVLFILTVYITSNYRKTQDLAVVAIVFSPVILYLAFSPNFRGFFTEGGRLVGANNDPNYLSTFLALGIIFAVSYFLFTKSNKRWLGVIYIIFSSPIFLWAYSRAAFLSLFFALFLLAFVRLSVGRSFKDIVMVGIVGITLIFSMVGSFFVLPSDSQSLIYRRSIAPVLSSEKLRGFMETKASDVSNNVYAVVSTEVPTDDFSYSRGEIWRDGLNLAIASPLGFGPAYDAWSPVGRVGRAHNVYLEVALTAGWAGAAIFLFFIYKMLRRSVVLLRSADFKKIGLAVGFLYLIINSFFLDMFTLRWLWLIMGIIVSYSYLENGEASKSISNTPNS